MTGLFVSCRSNTATSACHGKHGFETRDLAAKVCERPTRREAKALRPYHCPYCKKWHAGHIKKQAKTKRVLKYKAGRAPRRKDTESES